MNTPKHLILALASAAIALGACTSKPVNTTVKPLPVGIENIAEIDNDTVSVAFENTDFNWHGSNLQATVYSEDLYDSAAVAGLHVGDTIVYDAQPIAVTKVVAKDGRVVVNDGIEEGGAELQLVGGRKVYRAVTLDDHSVYTALGKTSLILNSDFKIIDCGENPDDPNDTITSNQKQYLESLPEGRRSFFQLNTKVVVKDGLVTEIQRRWIP